MSNSEGSYKRPISKIITTSSKLTNVELHGDSENYVKQKYLVKVGLQGMGTG